MKISALVGSLLLVMPLSATVTARAESTRSITLEEALALARANNRELRAARARVEQAAVGVEKTRAALLPTLLAQGRYTHNNKEVTLDLGAMTNSAVALAEILRQTSGSAQQVAALEAYEQRLAQATPAPIQIQHHNQLDVVLSASVPLIAPSAYPALSAARLHEKAGEATYETTLADVLFSVAQVYFASASADELLLARGHAVTVAQQTLDDAQARVHAKTANEIETIRAEAALLQARQALSEARDAKASIYRTLSTLLGTHDVLHVQPPGDSVRVEPPAIEAWVVDAKRLRPEIASLQATLEAFNASEKAALWMWAPTLSAFGMLRHFNYKSFSGDDSSWALGLTLDWVLFDGGSRDAQRHLAAAQAREAAARLEQLVDTVEDEVADARAAVDTKRQAVHAAHRRVQLANETLRLLRAQYDAQRVAQLDVLQAQDALVNAEVGMAQARLDLALGDLRLERAVGTFPTRHP